MAAKWPSLPQSVRGAGGPIRVRLRKHVRLKKDGDDCWGTWDDGTRTIRIERGALPQHKWRIFYHECCHAMLDDAGISHLLTAETQEALCNAFATSRMAETFGPDYDGHRELGME